MIVTQIQSKFPHKARILQHDFFGLSVSHTAPHAARRAFSAPGLKADRARLVTDVAVYREILHRTPMA